MATKKSKWASASDFTSSDVGTANIPPPQTKAESRYAQQRAFNAKPASERRTNDRNWQDPQFPARLKAWEAQNPVGVWKQHRQPKPVDYGRDQGGNWYTEARTPVGEPNFGGVTGKGNVGADQARWQGDRKGRDMTNLERRRGQYTSLQPLAKNERREGIEGNFGSLGNFFNSDD